MTQTAHILVAGAIANHVQDPTAATLLSFGSHFVLDSIPHWDVGTNWRDRKKYITGILAFADTFIGVLAGFLLFKDTVPLFILIPSFVASLAPDWLETPWYIFFAEPNKHKPGKHAGFLEHLTYRIYKIENTLHNKAPFPLGMITQVATVAFFLYLLK